jgi:hypothetical protein
VYEPGYKEEEKKKKVASDGGNDTYVVSDRSSERRSERPAATGTTMVLPSWGRTPPNLDVDGAWIG